ncbi:MAG: hypothetical protein V3V03_01230 [Hyphomonadaceae bacterium]
MDLQTIFFVQISMSVLIFTLIYRWYVSPWLADKPRNEALQILLLPHAFRHVGLFFLVPAFVTSDLSPSFANITAYGDLATAVLAIVALLALRAKFAFALPLVWLVNLVGTVDLIKALSEAENITHLGVVSFVPTFIVPLLLVSHVVIFTRLLRKNTEPSTDHAAA